MPALSQIPAQPQDAFNDYARVVADQQLAVVFGFRANLDSERLSQAVAELIASQPVLACRFVTQGRYAWHETVAGAGAVERIDDENAWARAIFEAGQPLPRDAAHLAVTHVVSPLGDALALRIDHTAADGQGARACAELLAAAYSGTLEADSRATATDRSWRRLRRAVGWPRLMRAARRRKDPPPTWGIPHLLGETGVGHHELLTLSAERFSAVRAWGRQHRYTVNDILLGAFYRALFELLSPREGEPMVVRVSFDQRRYLDRDDPMPAASNLSSIEPVSLGSLAGEQFPGTVARAATEMRHLKESLPGLGSVLLLETLYRLRGYEGTGRGVVEGMRRGQQAGRTYPFLSNFGVLQPEKVHFGDVIPDRAVMLPVVGHAPFAMLGASSFGGRLTLSMGFHEGEVVPHIARSILDSIDADLRL